MDIHVLYWCYGQYEDARQIPLAASFSLEKLEAEKEKHNIHNQQVIAWKKQLEDWNAQYREDHPKNGNYCVWEEKLEEAQEFFLDTLGVPMEDRYSLGYWEDSDYHSFYVIKDILWIE